MLNCYFVDEVNVTSSNISKMKKNEKAKDKTTKENVKKNKTTKADKKKVKKAKAEKKNAEKDEVSRPKSKKFRHRFFNIFCCCCGKTQESKDL
jgi:mannitol-specific phosphotransferase system IIBC component